jgi:hypothetical protein
MDFFQCDQLTRLPVAAFENLGVLVEGKVGED